MYGAAPLPHSAQLLVLFLCSPRGRWRAVHVQRAAVFDTVCVLLMRDGAAVAVQEDLSLKNVDDIIAALKNGETPTPGPQNGRKAAEPLGGRTTLLSPPRGPGKLMRTDGEL